MHPITEIKQILRLLPVQRLLEPKPVIMVQALPILKMQMT
jgi:hypothetical protein